MSSSPIHRITIKHPGYSGSNTILTLSACDGTNGGGRAHYATTLSACAIIANNCSGGWLSSSRTGQQRTYPDADGLIPPGTYFFHVDVEPDSPPYPVVPNFRAWSFPHDEVPQLWRQAAQSATMAGPRMAVETCRLTNMRLACETSHIVPVAEKSWFADNEMDQYGELGGRTGQDVADSPANLLRLRRDLHSLWDNLFFSIVPKATHADEGDSVMWHTHSMDGSPR